MPTPGADIRFARGADDERGPAGKRAAEVAQRIEAEIIARRWPVGAVLGTEQELRERYGVSRSVLREAVRLTEHHQVTRMRRGQNGGLFVAAPDAGPATRALVIYLEYIGLSVEDLMQARCHLEPLAVSILAGQITEPGAAQLRAALAAEASRRDEPGIFAQDAMHFVFAEMCGNPALELFIDVLARLTERYVQTTRRLPKDEILRGKLDSYATHVELVDAVIAGDGDLAAATMDVHLEAAMRWLLEHRSTRPKAVARTLEPPGAKLAEVVASAVRDEIARRGWPIGLVLGSETDLLARYGVSRSVLREAVRLLEYHSVARMRRGPGGGLVVTEPEAEASIDTMALHLDFRGVTPRDLLTVRDAIELGTLTQVIARRHDPDVRARLEHAIAITVESPEPGGRSADHFHTELADLSGNPVLALFLRILTELWSRHTANTPSPRPGPDGVAMVKTVHRKILHAVLDGDVCAARRRMRRHLGALQAWYHQ
ncbi:MAG TPA: FCD domain-containing protein [Amycolatopsis sp.]|nr:FCD domain-containing protein [Amycolatopsis sp.]